MKKIYISLLAASLLLVFVVSAFPQIPFEVWGTVTAKGKPVPDGTPIYAVGNGFQYETATETYNDLSYYIIQVIIDDPSTAEIEGVQYGDAVDLYIANVYAGSVEVTAGSFRYDLEQRRKVRLPRGKYCDRHPENPYCKL